MVVDLQSFHDKREFVTNEIVVFVLMDERNELAAVEFDGVMLQADYEYHVDVWLRAKKEMEMMMMKSGIHEKMRKLRKLMKEKRREEVALGVVGAEVELVSEN